MENLQSKDGTPVSNDADRPVRWDPPRAPRPAVTGEILCPLNRVQAGCAVRIHSLGPGSPHSQRLRELGFCEESVVRLINSKSIVVCLVCNARLAISVAMAEQILVEPLRAAGES